MFGMGARYLGIDLGTANTVVVVKVKGIGLREPSVVAMETKTKQIYAVGNEARKLIGRTPKSIATVWPMANGAIADYEITTMMMNHFYQKIHKRGILFNMDHVLICIPSGGTTVEKQAVIKAAKEAGARDAYLIESTFAAAIGSGLPIWKPTASMIVDIGAGTTEVMVISLGGIVTSHSIRVGGNAMDKSIMSYIRKKYNSTIVERIAEGIKMEMGTVGDIEKNASVKVRGRDQLTGLPKVIEIQTEDVRNALRDTVNTIIEAVTSTFEKIPPELAADMIDNGIIVTGGGALLDGLDKKLSEVTQMRVRIADAPLDCVAIGIGIALENTHLLKSSTK